MAPTPSMTTHGWRRRLHENMHTLQHTSCVSCQRKAHFGLLHQRQQLRGLDSSIVQHYKKQNKKVSGGSAGTESLPAMSETPKPVVQKRATSEPAQKPQGEKKRKLSQQDLETSKSHAEPKRAKVTTLTSEKKPEVKKAVGEAVKPKKPTSEPVKKPDTTKLAPRPQSDPPSKKPSSSSITSTISKTWPASIGTPKIKGLRNPGMFCYRRSTLQSLLCMPQLLALTASHPTSCKRQPCVTCALRNLATSYHSNKSSVNDAVAALDSAIAKTGRKSDPKWTSISPHTQEDAHDFLLYLLETLEKALKPKSSTTTTNPNNNNSSKAVPSSPFQSTYKVKHRATWTCASCKKCHINDSSNPPSPTLQLPIASAKTSPGTTATLASCFEAQHRETGTLIRCDGCKKQMRRTREILISSAPEVLTIHLKRFEFDGRRMSKNIRHVDIPEALDISPWATEDLKKREGKAGRGLRYRLQAVVLQAGSLNGGHYIAGVRGADGAGWREISDSHVEKVSIKELLGRRRETPYILSYTKIAGE